MCDPVSLAVATLGISAAGQYQQYQAMSAQADYQSELAAANQKQANLALAQQYNDISTRQSQEQQSATQAKEDIARQARAKMASSRVAAGEAGVSGISVELGMRDISGAASRDFSNIDQNLQWTIADLQRQKTSARTGAISQINSVPKGQQPSQSALALNLANTAVNSYGVYEATKPKTK